MVSITATLELNVKMGQNEDANGGNHRLILFCGLDIEAPAGARF